MPTTGSADPSSLERQPHDQEDSILENGKLKRVRYTYDQFNNVTLTQEYDFGQGVQGTLLRETARKYLVPRMVRRLMARLMAIAIRT